MEFSLSFYGALPIIEGAAMTLNGAIKKMGSQKGFLNHFLKTVFAGALILSSAPNLAHAVPAFAMREKVSCTLCHTDGSAPHLTKTGYLYRRAGFRFPGDIGNREKDDAGMSLTEHLAVGANVSYEVVTNKAPGTSSSVLTSNNFNVPEVEVWPIVGGFLETSESGLRSTPPLRRLLQALV